MEPPRPAERPRRPRGRPAIHSLTVLRKAVLAPVRSAERSGVVRLPEALWRELGQNAHSKKLNLHLHLHLHLHQPMRAARLAWLRRAS